MLWLWYVVIVAHFKSAWQRVHSFGSQDPVWATVAVRDSVASSRAVSRAVPWRDVWAPDHGNSQGSLAKFSQTSRCHGLRESGMHDHLICLHLILFVSRFQHAIWSDWTDVNRFFDFSLAGLPEANTFGRSEANNCRAKATQSGRRGFSFRIVFDRFWLVRLKPSHHVCHAIVHLWKIAIPDPNLLKLTHTSDGAAEHPVRIQLFTHTGC